MIRFEEIISETEPVAMIRKDPDEIKQTNKLEFKESYDDLDYLIFATLPLPSGNQVSLVRHLHSPKPGTEICVSYEQLNIPKVLKDTLSKMNLTWNDLAWVHPEYEEDLKELIEEQQLYESIYSRDKNLFNKA
jgi:hypothetical protein